jgi:hypothetical protein
MGLRRLLALVAAGTTGLVAGAGGMLATQAPEPIKADNPTGGPPADQPVDTEPLPEPSSNVLLVWTPTALDPTLAFGAQDVDGVEDVSIVRGGLADLVASRDAEGTVVDQPTDGWFIPLDTVAIEAISDKFAGITSELALLAMAPNCSTYCSAIRNCIAAFPPSSFSADPTCRSPSAVAVAMDKMACAWPLASLIWRCCEASLSLMTFCFSPSA